MPPALLFLVIFQTECNVYAQASLDVSSPIYTFHVAGITGMYYHPQLFIG
jgi:hypothetical protein